MLNYIITNKIKKVPDNVDLIISKCIEVLKSEYLSDQLIKNIIMLFVSVCKLKIIRVEKLIFTLMKEAIE